jgi:hypothetical protein
VRILFSDRGTPDGYRHMDGFSSHTFSLTNAKNELFYVKWHFKTKQGIKNFTGEAAAEMRGIDPDYAQRDLFEAIKRGDFPKWRVYMQIMPEKEAETYHINPFDLTKVWPHRDYPLIEVGELTLDRTPENYFAEVEQAAFEPRNVVLTRFRSTSRSVRLPPITVMAPCASRGMAAQLRTMNPTVSVAPHKIRRTASVRRWLAERWIATIIATRMTTTRRPAICSA